MKNFSSRLVRFSMLTALLALVPALARADDRALHLLQLNGAVGVKIVNDSLESGADRSDVYRQLGQPSKQLKDGSVLYQNFTVSHSAANGTLRVEFVNDRVTDMTLLSPATLAALPAGTEKASRRVALVSPSQR